MELAGQGKRRSILTFDKDRAGGGGSLSCNVLTYIQHRPLPIQIGTVGTCGYN